MIPGEEQVKSLREALAVSPDNVPLRRLLAETLAGLGRTAEAETEYRAALRTSPEDAGLLLGLARTFHAAGKTSECVAVVETLAGRRDCPGAVHVLHARLLLAGRRRSDAARAYQRGVKADPAAADRDLEAALGEDAAPEPAPRPARAAAGFDPSDDPDVEAALDEDEREPDLERPRISFKDVGGMEPLKEEIRMKILLPLQHPELFASYGKAAGGGLLLYGPPGCGKTHIARATAGEVKAGFVSVGLHEILDMWIGNSEKRLHELFVRARRNRPCVLFFDEVDALGASRGDFRQSWMRMTINQFLAEMDGADGGNEGVLVIGATNMPWHLDPAFRRPGRFDRVLFVPPPDVAARAEILRILLRGRPTQDVDHDLVASKTPDFSGADLKGLVEATLEAKLREALRAGRPSPVTTRDLVAAAKTLRRSTEEWFATARNYAVHANEDGQYDEVLRYIERRRR